jgi:hypothetical protein
LQQRRGEDVAEKGVHLVFSVLSFFLWDEGARVLLLRRRPMVTREGYVTARAFSAELRRVLTNLHQDMYPLR